MVRVGLDDLFFYYWILSIFFHPEIYMNRNDTVVRAAWEGFSCDVQGNFLAGIKTIYQTNTRFHQILRYSCAWR